MTPPPPTVSNPKPENALSDDIRQAIEERNAKTRAILEAALQEAPNTQRLGGVGVGCKKSFTSYNGHNYRLYLDFEKAGFNPNKGLGRGWVSAKPINGGHEWLFIHETGSQVRIKKVLAEIRYLTGKLDWFMIDNSKPGEIEKLTAEKRKGAVALFTEFVILYGGRSQFKVIKEDCFDNKEKDNALIDRQRFGDTYETPIVKRRYPWEKSLEYKDLQSAINAAHNAGLYDFSPEIVNAFETVAAEITRLGAGLSTSVANNPDAAPSPNFNVLQEIDRAMQIIQPVSFEDKIKRSDKLLESAQKRMDRINAEAAKIEAIIRRL